MLLPAEQFRDVVSPRTAGVCPVRGQRLGRSEIGSRRGDAPQHRAIGIERTGDHSLGFEIVTSHEEQQVERFEAGRVEHDHVVERAMRDTERLELRGNLFGLREIADHDRQSDIEHGRFEQTDRAGSRSSGRRGQQPSMLPGEL